MWVPCPGLELSDSSSFDTSAVIVIVLSENVRADFALLAAATSSVRAGASLADKFQVSAAIRPASFSFTRRLLKSVLRAATEPAVLAA